MPTIWSFFIDWTNDGDFSDSNEDVTAQVISANWQLGMTRPYIDTADDSVLTIVLDNSDRHFSPEYGSGALWPNVKPFRKVRVQSNDGTTTRTHWTGWIERIAPDVSKYGQRRVAITAAGPMQLLKSTEASLDLQYNKRTDEVIYDLLRVPWMDPPTDPDQDLLDETPIPLVLELDPATKYRTMEVSADNWYIELTDKNAKFSLYRAIADVAAAERGRFFFQRDGSAVFWDRMHLQRDLTSAVTLNDSMVDMTYVYASDEVTFRNDIRVTCHPRTAGDTATTLLWKLEKPITIEPGKTKRLKVNYKKIEEGDARTGADEVTQDAVVFSKGSADITIKSKGDNAKIKLVNTASHVSAVLTSLKLRGRKIEDFGEEEVSAENLASIEEFGRHTLSMSLNSVEEREYAQMIADYELWRRGTPRGMVTQVTLRSHAKVGGGTHASQLALTIGDCITLTETQTGQTSKRYVIIGEAHKLTDAATLLETTWYLEPIGDTNTGWRVEMAGRSTLDSATRLYF